MLGINLFGSYNLHLIVMTKLFSWKKRITESIRRNSGMLFASFTKSDTTCYSKYSWCRF